jgi:hypothetical protein
MLKRNPMILVVMAAMTVIFGFAFFINAGP